jgi:hypothetical protein
MRSKVWTSVLITSFASLTVALCAAPPDSERESTRKATAEPTEKPQDVPRVSVEEARKRAKLAHSIYSSTLDVIHHRYFRNDRSAIPARTMEDIFQEVSSEENMQARWISVNTRAMSIDHEPEDEFEKSAAKAIASGQESYESVVDGNYRRAGAISLMNRGCLGCHLGFGASTKIDRFAGLVITIPVETP